MPITVDGSTVCLFLHCATLSTGITIYNIHISFIGEIIGYVGRCGQRKMSFGSREMKIYT